MHGTVSFIPLRHVFVESTEMRNDKVQFDLATKKLVVILKYLKKAGTGMDYGTLRNELVMKKWSTTKTNLSKVLKIIKRLQEVYFLFEFGHVFKLRRL